jgi:LuxR family quorum-sensing system transcriptional regulator SolR
MSDTDTKQIKEQMAAAKCEEVAEIMLPQLKKHGITVFNYYRMYFDGSVIRLSTDRAWTEHYFKKDYLNKSTVPPSYLEKPLNYFIWLLDDCPELLLDAATNFNTSNGISIAKRHEDSIEYFCFATTTHNTAIINNFYINNLDVLQNYCAYFNERAQNLLNFADKNRLVITSSIDQGTSRHPSSIKLSDRQLDCAYLLLKGMSYKQIGSVLNLSPRTVETHLAYLKTKLNCHNKTELIIKLSSILLKTHP